MPKHRNQSFVNMLRKHLITSTGYFETEAKDFTCHWVFEGSFISEVIISGESSDAPLLLMEVWVTSGHPYYAFHISRKELFQFSDILEELRKILRWKSMDQDLAKASRLQRERFRKLLAETPTKENS